MFYFSFHKIHLNHPMDTALLMMKKTKMQNLMWIELIYVFKIIFHKTLTIERHSGIFCIVKSWPQINRSKHNAKIVARIR